MLLPLAGRCRPRGPACAAKTWVWGNSEEDPSFLPFSWMGSGAGPTVSIQPLTPHFCHVSAQEIFFQEIKDFWCVTKSQLMPKARWPSCSHGDGHVVTGKSERSLLCGQNWKARTRESLCVCVNSSRAPGREALGKKHQMGELVVSVQPDGQGVERGDPQSWSRGFKWPHPAKGPEIWGRR